ncbi:MAG: CPBP family intramembrane metalloprotease [Streptosporangiales bacterium]|nr:CPBP family intramembrane metalloprotease [Streptosporangiales bacterium]
MRVSLRRSEAPRGEPPRRSAVSPAVALGTLVVLAPAVLATDWLARSLESRNSSNPAETTAEMTWWDVISAVVQHALILAAVLVAVRLATGRIAAPSLGLRRTPWRPAIANAAVIYSAYVLLAALASAILGPPPARDSANALAQVDADSLLIIYAVTACVLAPPIEELFFRGFLFPALRSRLGTVPAVLLAGALFSVAHAAPPAAMLQLALLGVTLCTLYQRTRSLLPGIAVHAAHNAVAFAAITSLSLPATIGLMLAAALTTIAITSAFAVSTHNEPTATHPA